MAIYQRLKPDGRELAIALASRAFREARSQSTSRPGSVYIPNGDGTGTMIGPAAGTDQTGGSNGISPFIGDTTPPGKPIGMSASSSGGVLVVSWDGSLDGGIPADFAFVRVFAECEGETSVLGDLRGAGTVSSGSFSDGQHVVVWGMAYDSARDGSGSLAPNASKESDRISIEVTDLSQQALNVANATGQHFWSDDSGVHVSTEERVADGFSNVLINALGILLRAAQNNLISITEDGIAIYDGLGNGAENVVAEFSAAGSRIGYQGENSVTMGADGITISDGNQALASFSENDISIGVGKLQTPSQIKICGDSVIGSYKEHTAMMFLYSDGGVLIGKEPSRQGILAYEGGIGVNNSRLYIGVDDVMFDISGEQTVYTSDYISSMLAARIDVRQSQSFSDISVKAWYRSGTVTVSVSRSSDSQTALTLTSDSQVGTLKSGYAPPANLDVLMGLKPSSGAWLLLGVRTSGSVVIKHRYGPSQELWGSFSAVITYVV